MKFITGILILTLNTTVFSMNPEEGNFYEVALREAGQYHKFILLDFTATWCGGCLGYDKYVFQDSTTMVKISEKFILLKIDRDKPENSFLVKKYRIYGLPHIVVINAEERILGSLNGFYSEFVENPGSFISKLESIVDAQERIKILESEFMKDSTRLEIINSLLAAYKGVDQYIEIQHLNNLRLRLNPTPELLYEYNLNQAIRALRLDGNLEPVTAFLKANPELDTNHKYEIYSQFLFYYGDQNDIKNQDIYYLKLLKLDPNYYKRKYADFLFENNLKIDTAIILANEHNSIEAYKDFWWTHYLNAHILSYSGKPNLAVETYSQWMEKNRKMLMDDDDYWAFYFYAKFANIHSVDLERALDYIQIAEKRRNMIDEKILMAEILYKLHRVDDSLDKLDESLVLTQSQKEHNRINDLIKIYSKMKMPKDSH